MRILRLTIYVCLLVALCGCAPMSVVYYKPSAANGNLVERGCGRLAGPRAGIEFTNYGLVLEARARAHDGVISLRVTVPDGKSAVFMSDELDMNTDIPGESRKLQLAEMTYNDYLDITNARHPQYVKVPIKPTDAMIGKRYQLSSSFFQTRSHSTEVRVEGTIPDQFYLKLPVILFGSIEIEYPLIKFTKTKGFGIYSVNC